MKGGFSVIGIARQRRIDERLGCGIRFSSLVTLAVCASVACSAGPGPQSVDGSSEAPTVASARQAFAATTGAAVLATNSVLIKANANVAGDIRVTNASNATLNRRGELVIAKSATTAGSLVADTIWVHNTASSSGYAYYNKLTGPFDGLPTEGLSIPVSASFPATPTVTPGSEDVALAKKEDRTLARGAYGDVLLKSGTSANKTVLTLSGGVYEFRSFDFSAHGNVECAGACEIRIAERLLPGGTSYVGPADGSGLGPADVSVYVLGSNGD